MPSPTSLTWSPTRVVSKTQRMDKMPGMKWLGTHIRVQPEVVLDTGRWSECPSRSLRKALSGCADVYILNFRGSQPAVIEVVGGATTDLDCYLYDQNGNLLRRDIPRRRMLAGMDAGMERAVSPRDPHLGSRTNPCLLVTN